MANWMEQAEDSRIRAVVGAVGGVTLGGAAGYGIGLIPLAFGDWGLLVFLKVPIGLGIGIVFGGLFGVWLARHGY